MPQLETSLIRPKKSWHGVQFFCTSRSGGVSRPPYGSFNLGLGAGDQAQAVLNNRKLLRGLLPADPCWLKQVHAAEVANADDPALFGCDQDAPEFDAAVTQMPGKVLAILTADCLPVVMSDLDGRVLGVAHAGWRGLASGVLESTLQAMVPRYPSARGWQAWIGPAIGAQCFQVGPDVREAFVGNGAEQPGLFSQDPSVPGKWLADLAGLAAWRLKRMGVEHVEKSGLCTVSDPLNRFFSYRRDGKTGRMATLAWLEHTN